MKANVVTLLRAVKAVSEEIDRDLPLTITMVFLCVARAGTEGVDQGQIQDELEMSSSGISRAVQTLGEMHYLKGKAGLRLITREFDPTDNRKRVLKLTPAGNKLMRAVLGAMEA